MCPLPHEPVPAFVRKLGVPVRKKELINRPGKQPDGSAKTREVKLVTIRMTKRASVSTTSGDECLSHNLCGRHPRRGTRARSGPIARSGRSADQFFEISPGLDSYRILLLSYRKYSARHDAVSLARGTASRSVMGPSGNRMVLREVGERTHCSMMDSHLTILTCAREKTRYPHFTRI